MPEVLVVQIRRSEGDLNQMKRVAVVLLTVPLVALGVPALAGPGDNTCLYDEVSKTVTLTIVQDSANATLRRGFENDITAHTEDSGEFDCGDSTVENTDSIEIANESGVELGYLELFLHTGLLAPGAADEPGDSDEIEVQVDAGAGLRHIDVTGPKLEEVFLTAGLGGDTPVLLINTNADEQNGVDADVTVIGDVGQLRLQGHACCYGGLPPAHVSAAGGDGTGEPYDSAAHLSGNSQSDELTGGTGNNYLSGSEGPDLLVGGPGEDYFSGDAGDDVVRLRGGADYGVTQKGNDTVFGGAGADHLEGGNQNDEIHGGLGPDHLEGGTGDDSLFGEEGSDDLVGGAGTDLCYGGPAADTFKGCRPAQI
jgi:Ca2+-binding RTX toxin-like protein